MMNSPEYEAAYTAMRQAHITYAKIRDAYRAKTIGDAEYLAARTAWVEATALFDAAHAKESA